MVTAVLSLPPAELASSEAPLAQIYEYYTGEKAIVISIIGMFAIINGALIQMIMASRVVRIKFTWTATRSVRCGTSSNTHTSHRDSRGYSNRSYTCVHRPPRFTC
jgi:hypothetical protein